MATNWIIGGAIVLFVVRQVREKFLEHLHADRPTTKRDLAHLAADAASGSILGKTGVFARDDADDTSPRTRAEWTDRVRWGVSIAARLAFLVWLYDVTDGYAFSPFAFLQDAFGGSWWPPVLLVLGLTEVLARGGAMAVRAARGTDRKDAEPVRAS